MSRASLRPGYYLEAYRALIRNSMAAMLQYRFAILIWAVWGFVGPLVSLAVWSAASAGRGGQITAASGDTFTRADFAAYFFVYMVFGHLTMSWDAFEFSYRVRSGQLSFPLMRPIHPIHADASNNIAFKSITSAMLLPVWLVMVLVLKPALPTDPLPWLLAVPALLLAAMIRYVLQYSLAVIAFWTTRTDAVNQFYFTLDSFLAGRIAPLALMPGWLGAVALFSPFRAMGAFPVELALGRLTPPEIAQGFLLQAAWLVVALGVLRLMWAAGVRQYSAVGA